MLLWIDLETTGLDENLDRLLEVAAVLTDEHLNIQDELNIIIKCPTEIATLASRIIKDMHTANNLWGEAFWKSDVPSARVADLDLYIWLLEHGVNLHEKIRLAGSGVSHFDKRWIAKHLPRTDALLQHATIDVGVVRRFLTDICSAKDLDKLWVKSKTHRAMDDIKQHIDEAKWYRDLIKRSVTQ